MLWIMIAKWFLPLCTILLIGWLLSLKKGYPPIFLALLEFVVLGAGHIVLRRYAIGILIVPGYFLICFVIALVIRISRIEVIYPYMLTLYFLFLLIVSFYSARSVKDSSEEQRMYNQIKKDNLQMKRLLMSQGINVGAYDPANSISAIPSGNQTDWNYNDEDDILENMWRQNEEELLNRESEDDLEKLSNDYTNDHHHDDHHHH